MYVHVYKCVNIINSMRREEELTLLALRTCSLLVGSIPDPVHDTNTKSVSCPVCIILVTDKKVAYDNINSQHFTIFNIDMFS